VAIFGLFYIAFEETCNGCVLSHYQFLGKLGIKNYNRDHLFIFIRYYLPLLLVMMGILFQDILSIIKPII